MNVRRLAQNSTIAVAAASLSLSTFHRIQYSWDIVAILPVAITTFIFYHALTSRRSIRVTEILLALMVCVWAAIDLNARFDFLDFIGPAEVILIVLAGLTALLYKPSLWGFKIKGLREMAFIKPLAISFCWSFITFLYPCWLMHTEDEIVAAGFFERFLFILPLAIMSDYFDVEQEPQLNTIPRRYSLQLTRVLIVALFLLHQLILLQTGMPRYMVLPDVLACTMIISLRQGYSFSKVMTVESIPLLHGLMMLI